MDGRDPHDFELVADSHASRYHSVNRSFRVLYPRLKDGTGRKGYVGVMNREAEGSGGAWSPLSQPFFL